MVCLVVLTLAALLPSPHLECLFVLFDVRSVLCDALLQGREVQQRLVAQRQRAVAKASMARATRNVSKARGKHAKKAAAALSEW